MSERETAVRCAGCGSFGFSYWCRNCLPWPPECPSCAALRAEADRLRANMEAAEAENGALRTLLAMKICSCLRCRDNPMPTALVDHTAQCNYRVMLEVCL